MKLLLITTNITEPKTLKKFEKLIKRDSKDFLAVWPGVWFVRTELGAEYWGSKLNALCEDTDKVICASLLTDNHHLNGWLPKSQWDWCKK